MGYYVSEILLYHEQVDCSPATSITGKLHTEIHSQNGRRQYKHLIKRQFLNLIAQAT